MSDATEQELIDRPDRGQAAVMHRYHGRRAVLSTKHHKLALIGPNLQRHVGLVVDAVPVDTDRLGTFTGDKARSGSAWETAVAKARLGMNAAGVRLGLASEGSIGPPPGVAFVLAARELVVLVDDERGLVVGESAIGYDIITIAADVAPGDDIERLLQRGAFPEHGMIVRPAAGPPAPLHKGIHDRSGLDDAIRACAAVSPDGRAHIETDLRAHHCPSRRPTIAAAAHRLAQRLAALCPMCATPGWGVVRVELGVPCQHCRRPVQLPSADVFGCAACTFEQTLTRPESRGADPGRCSWCNP